MKDKTADEASRRRGADRANPTLARAHARHGVTTIYVDVARAAAARRELAALALRFPELREAPSRARLAAALETPDGGGRSR